MSKLKNVVALNNAAFENPRLAEAIDEEMNKARAADLLANLDIIRKRVKKGEIEGVVVIGVGADDFPDLTYISTDIWEHPAPVIGMLEAKKADLIDHLRFGDRAEEDDYESDD